MLKRGGGQIRVAVPGQVRQRLVDSVGALGELLGGLAGVKETVGYVGAQLLMDSTTLGSVTLPICCSSFSNLAPNSSAT
ncbi:hypothetical protein D3C59_34000 [Streptomyces sp. SHP22-7]|nr:hypothetical protein D3C59_34000 [Streptomyces sp. SHP22-7]